MKIQWIQWPYFGYQKFSQWGVCHCLSWRKLQTCYDALTHRPQHRFSCPSFILSCISSWRNPKDILGSNRSSIRRIICGVHIATNHTTPKRLVGTFMGKLMIGNLGVMALWQIKVKSVILHLFYPKRSPWCLDCGFWCIRPHADLQLAYLIITLEMRTRCLDCGSSASNHMCGSSASLFNYCPCHEDIGITVANGSLCKAARRGDNMVFGVPLKYAFYVSQLHCNLISVPKLAMLTACTIYPMVVYRVPLFLWIWHCLWLWCSSPSPTIRYPSFSYLKYFYPELFINKDPFSFHCDHYVLAKQSCFPHPPHPYTQSAFSPCA